MRFFPNLVMQLSHTLLKKKKIQDEMKGKKNSKPFF